MNNSIMTLYPYKYRGQLVFDDPATGLVREAFIAGADDILDKLTANIPHAEYGFVLLFSSEPFPGHQIKVQKLGPKYGGNMYRCEELGMDGYLCPALFKYFRVAPEFIYAQVKPGQKPSILKKIKTSVTNMLPQRKIVLPRQQTISIFQE